MTKDQKTVLKAIAVAVSFKAALFAGITYASRHYRRCMTAH